MVSKTQSLAISFTDTVSFADQFTVSVMHTSLLIAKGGTAKFTITTTAVGSLSYQWWKRPFSTLPDKALGRDTALLRIPQLEKSDEGQYYCIVTNMWNRSLESDSISLTIYGTYIC